MAIHGDSSSMSKEAIEEYLAVAYYCLNTEKPGGGIYGYPAVLLLFLVTEALSNYRAGNNYELLKEIFPTLNDEQIKCLRDWYRHPLTHQAVIMPGSMLSPELVGDPVELNQGEPTLIRVIPFYNAVLDIWKKFPMNEIKPNVQKVKGPPQRMTPLPTISAVTSTSLTASGAYIDMSKKSSK